MLKGVFASTFPAECFPPEWLDCTVPVFFDYAGHIQSGDWSQEAQRKLFGLLPGRAEGQAVIVSVSRESFVSAALSRQEIIPSQIIVERIALDIARQRVLANAEFAAQYRNYHQWKRRPTLKTAWLPKRRVAGF